MPFSKKYEWDCSTVGRSDNEKHPFFIHKKLSSSDKVSLVMTNDAVYKSARMNQYVADNQDWDCPQCGKSNFAKRTECFSCGRSKRIGGPRRKGHHFSRDPAPLRSHRYGKGAGRRDE